MCWPPAHSCLHSKQVFHYGKGLGRPANAPRPSISFFQLSLSSLPLFFTSFRKRGPQRELHSLHSQTFLLRKGRAHTRRSSSLLKKEEKARMTKRNQSKIDGAAFIRGRGAQLITHQFIPFHWRAIHFTPFSPSSINKPMKLVGLF